MKKYQKDMQELASFIQSAEYDQRTFESQKRLNIYKINFIEGIIELLQGKYPAVYADLKENNFRYICFKFLSQSPPESEDKNIYGDTLPLFLRNQKEMDNRELLCELATLDLHLYKRHEHPENTLIKVSVRSFDIWNSLRKKTSTIDFDQTEENIILFLDRNFVFQKYS